MDKAVLRERVGALAGPASLFRLINDIKALHLGARGYEITPRHFRLLMDPEKSCGYRCFSIRKKSGGARQIWAPRGNLKWIQYCIKEIVELFYEPRPCVTGFVRGRSIMDNALSHTGKAFIFNIDISNFFETITATMIARRLTREPYALERRTADTIARLSCRCRRRNDHTPEFVLAQGSPSSPVIANAVCDDMDIVLTGLASRFGLTYTRYADDITFSSDHNVYFAGSPFRKELARIIEAFGFAINEGKTRLSHRSQHQEVTGLTVNAAPNICRRWYKELRGALHIWERYGKNAALNAFYPRYLSSHDAARHGGTPDLENILYGRLCFMKMVVGEGSERYIRLRDQFQRLTARAAAPQGNDRWTFLFTMPLRDFERIFNTKVTLHFSSFLTALHAGIHHGISDAEAQTLPPRHYGLFRYDGVDILVALSRRLQNRPIPPDAQISLCQTPNPSRPLIYLLHLPSKK